VAEGVLLFLPGEGVRRLVTTLKTNAPGAVFLCDAAGHRLRQRQGAAFAGVGAPIGWTVRDEGDVAALGLMLEQVWPALYAFPERWGDLLPRPVPPPLRSNSLVIRARV
jgi:hypothetical protein